MAGRAYAVQMKSRMRFVLASGCAALIMAAAALLQSGTDGARFIAAALAATKDPVQADVDKFLALYGARNYEAASVMAPALLDKIRARTGEDNPFFIQILSYAVECYTQTGRDQEAEQLLKLAIPIVEKNLGPDQRQPWAIAGAVGAFVLAIRALLRSRAGAQARGGDCREGRSPDEGSLQPALNELAVFYASAGRYAEAEEAYRRTLTVEEKRLGPTLQRSARYCSISPRSTSTWAVTKKRTAFWRGHKPLSNNRSCRKRAKPGRPRSAAATPKSSSTSPSAAISVLPWTAIPRPSPTISAVWPSLRDDTRSLPGLASAILIQNLGQLYLKKQGRYAEAEPLLKRVLAIDENAFGSNNYWAVEILDGLGTTYRHLGRDAEAEASYARALEIGQKVLGERHIDVGNVLRDLAAFKLATGHTVDALDFARKGVTIATGLVKDSANGAGLSTQSLGSHFEVMLDALQRAPADGIVGAGEPRKPLRSRNG